MSKIQPIHLERAAYIYVRQSTLAQVHNNVESQKRQYALADRARELGWQDVHVIDDDLGCSGSGQVQRQGFEALLADVCQGRVGAVFAIEASRLARNGQEWHRLLEFSALVDTLIVDHDGIYDPKHANDRLLLGLKGTMSEMETSTFRQRSQEAIRQKARRGEHYTRIAEGYQQRDDGALEKDADEQVRHTHGAGLQQIPRVGQCPTGVSLVSSGRHQASQPFESQGVQRRMGAGDAVDDYPHLEGSGLRGSLCLWTNETSRDSGPGPKARGEAEALASGGLGSFSSRSSRGLHFLARVLKNQETAGPEPESARRGSAGIGAEGQRTAGRPDPLRALWPKMRVRYSGRRTVKARWCIISACLSWREKSASNCAVCLAA